MTAFVAALMLVAMAPQANDQLYREGVAARLAGDNAQAATLLTRVVAAEPGNADAALQLGLVNLALGQLDEAEVAFRRTLVLAPNYDDARIGLARVAQRRGDSAQALATLAPVAPGN
ncbi:MAG: tetratricopeptide repeat protein, partial [Pseudomonadota bacterium]|nr:tetratricopeptide repeat protein [Pseudomonadota bacterium]